MTARRASRSLGITILLLVAGGRPAFADVTLGVFLGGARTHDSSIRLTQAVLATDVTLSPVRYRSDSLDTPVYYAYRVAFFPHSRWIGIEGELIHLKVIAETTRQVAISGQIGGEPVSGVRPLAAVLERFAITHGVNLLVVNIVARRELRARSGGLPRWLLSGRLGAGASIPHAESTIAGISQEQYEWGSPSLQAAGGVELRLVKRVYAAAEYKFTHTVQHVAVPGGSVRTPLSTHHLVTGIVVRLKGSG